jgi:methylated-DNA-[protein]-cysteine S-methyltransferase
LAVQLPEERVTRTVNRLQVLTGARHPIDPPEAIRDAIRQIQLHIGGQIQDFSKVHLDMSRLDPFDRAVYEAARRIPGGERKSYGDVARSIGRPGSARAIGQALGRNPFAIIVPCHRVVNASGKLGGFSAKLLALEGSADGQLPFDGETAVAMIAESDAQMADLMRRVGPFKFKLRPLASTFDSLAQAIAYQQLSGKAAATILGRVRALFPQTDVLDPVQVLATPDERFRSAGLSRSKTLALKDLAAKTVEGVVPSPAELAELSDDEIIERLSSVRGIGRWTVEMLLIFRLGRPNVLPVTDYGVRKGFALTFKKRRLPKPAELDKRGKRWAPFRTVASWYFWRALELPRVEK